MIRILPIALILIGCAPRSPRFPGPLAAVGSHTDLADGPSELPEQPADAVGRTHRRARPVGSAIAKAADHYLTHKPRGFRDDCSGFVCAALARAGMPMEGNTRSLWEWASDRNLVHHKKKARLGDLVFFDNTYDRNRNGRWDDPLSHIAIVIAIDEEGTMTLAHGGTSKGRTTMRMNLHHPDSTAHNSYLRAKKSGDKKSVRYLSGQLCRGFATLTRDELDLAGG